MLKFERVTKRFRGKDLFPPLTWSLDVGKLGLIAGRNGSGKTSLLKMIATLLLPATGEIFVDSVSVLRFPLLTRRRISYLPPDNSGFYGNLSGRENLRFFSALQSVSTGTLAERLPPLAGPFGLAPHLDQAVQTYSTGMKKKLAILRALLPARPLLCLDEPTQFLDEPSTLTLWDCLREELRRGVTILLTSTSAELPLPFVPLRLTGGTAP